MKQWLMGVTLLTALALSGVATAAQDGRALSLDQYTATVSQDALRDLEAKGLDVVSAEQLASGSVEVDLVLTKQQVLALRAQDINVRLQRNEFGQSARQFAATMAVAGFNVWRDYDSPDGHRAQLYAIAEDNPDITKLVVLGQTIQGRELIALKVTQDAGKKDGRKPAVLYTSTQHAREWITPEVNSRLLKHFVNGWRNGDQEIKESPAGERVLVRHRRQPRRLPVHLLE